MQKSRILLVIAGLPAGGAERQMALLARHLDRQRFAPGLLIFGRRERIHYSEALEGLDWFRALELAGDAPRALLLARLFAGIRAAVADFRPDLIHASLNKANHAVRATALLSGWRIPVVTSVRNDFRTGHSGAERLAERLLCRRSARLLANSPAVARQLAEDLPAAAGRIVTVPNGIAPTFFDAAGPPPDWWPRQGRTALVVGRFTAQKNHLGLMAALARLEMADWTVALVGEGPLAEAIRAAAPPGRVVIAPPVEDPRPLYRAASLLLLPSRFEGMPNVALEAQAAGCPVALTPAANAAQVVEPDSGWLLDGDLADALAPVLAASPAEMRRRGEMASRRMAERFSLAAMVAATEAVYADVLHGDCSPAG